MANGLNPQIPLSAQYTPVDVVGSMQKGYQLKQEKMKTEEMDQERQDRAIYQDYLKQGGDLTTPEGVNKAIEDLKGKVSPDQYSKLIKFSRESDVWTRKQMEDYAKLPEIQLNAQIAKSDVVAQAMEAPLQMYQNAVAEKGEPAALQDFEASKQAVVQQLTTQKNPDGSPMFPPQMLQNYLQMAPPQMKSTISSTRYQQKLMNEAAKRRRDEAQAAYFEAGAEERARGKDVIALESIAETFGQDSPEYQAAVAKLRGRGGAAAGAQDQPGGVGSAMYQDPTTGQKYSMNSRTGQAWELDEEGKWKTVNPAQVPKNVVKVGAIGTMGARESVFTQREILAANQAAKDLANVVKLPISVSSGLFGGRKQGPGLLAATKEVLANKVTTDEVQIYNVMSTGFQRSLAAIEAAGLMPTGSLTHQMDAVILKEGDSNLTKMSKLAQTRQIVEAGMEVLVANPRISDLEKSKAEAILKDLEKAVPYKQEDVINWMVKSQKNPNLTLEEAMRGKKKGKADTTTEATPPARKATAEPAGTMQVSPEVQAGRDTERSRILGNELASEKAQLAAATTEDEKRLHEGNIASISRELGRTAASKTTKATPKKTPASRNAKGWPLLRDAQGNMAYVGPNNEIEEIK